MTTQIQHGPGADGTDRAMQAILGRVLAGVFWALVVVVVALSAAALP